MEKEKAREKLMAIANGLIISVSCTCQLDNGGLESLVRNINNVLKEVTENRAKVEDLIEGCNDNTRKWERKIENWLFNDEINARPTGWVER